MCVKSYLNYESADCVCRESIENSLTHYNHPAALFMLSIRQEKIDHYWFVAPMLPWLNTIQLLFMGYLKDRVPSYSSSLAKFLIIQDFQYIKVRSTVLFWQFFLNNSLLLWLQQSINRCCISLTTAHSYIKSLLFFFTICTG